jgi:3-oxoacyl-[acyl-carrier-protein] synthase II
MVTALGGDVASTWDGLLAGRSGIRAITAFDASRVASRIAGEVPDFDPSPVLDRKEQRRNDRYTHLALVAAREASEPMPACLERLEGTPRSGPGSS